MSLTRLTDTPHHYEAYLNTARSQEKKRMGYPLTGNSKLPHYLIDYSLFGITSNSLADNLILTIGDPESSLSDQTKRHQDGIFYPEDIENQITTILSHHFGRDDGSLKGYVTTGGTEANLACIWWLRNYLQQGNPSQSVVLYASSASHYSCKKVCQTVGIKFIEVPSLQNGQLNCKALADCLKHHELTHPDAHTIIWLNAGTTIQGAVDDIHQVKSLVLDYTHQQKRKAVIHLDGAILGVTLPLLYQGYHDIFSLIDTLSLSGHKLLGVRSASGVALSKRLVLENAFNQDDIAVPYVHGVKDITITGGRSALPIFQLHLSLQQYEFAANAGKFKRLLEHCLLNAAYLFNALVSLIGADHVSYNNNQFNVVFKLLFSAEKADWLKEKYTLMPVPDSRACISVFPNVDRALIDEFLTDYKRLYCATSLNHARL